MRSRVLVILVLVLLAGLLLYQRESARRKLKSAPVVSPPVKTAATIEGTYRTEGQNPDGSSYTGTLEVKQHGDRFDLEWQAGEIKFSGVGLRADSILAVTYIQKDKTRTAVYKIGPQKMEGRWTAFGDSLFGREVCTKQ